MRYAGFDIIGALEYWAQTQPEALALTDGDIEFSYSGLHAEVTSAASRLTALGVAPEDRVLLVGNNTWQWVACYLATLRVGAVSVPMNNRLAPAQVADLVKAVGPRVALADDDHVSLFSECRGLALLSIDGSAARALSSVDGAGFEPGPKPAELATAVISFTSGTTGLPKGAVISHRALGKASAVYRKTMEFGNGDSTLIVAPLFHNTGFVDQLGAMLLSGGRSDLLRRYRTREAINAFNRRPSTFITAVPSVLRLLMTADGADAAYGVARNVLFGGSPMPAPWSAEMHERWPDLKLWHGYGLTEFTSCCTLLPPDMITEHGASIGYPIEGVKLRLVDENGCDVADGSSGEIWVAGETRMDGYWNRPDATAEKLDGEWLRTGDLAERRELGLIYHVGRVDDVINRGGEKILPSFVEAAIAEIAAIAQGVVFAVPHPILQSSVIAAVELRPGSSFDETVAVAFLKERIPGYAIPERIIVAEELPRTASGKIDRRAARSNYITSLNSIAS